MHFKKEFVHHSIEKASTGSISFDELSPSFTACNALTTSHKPTILDVAVAIFSVSATHRHFKQYKEKLKKYINIRNGSKKFRLE